MREEFPFLKFTKFVISFEISFPYLFICLFWENLKKPNLLNLLKSIVSYKRSPIYFCEINYLPEEIHYFL